jgi:hypothetical protein
VAEELWLGLASGIVALVCSKLPVMPEPAASNYLIKLNYPLWVAMGSLVWLTLLRLVLRRPLPAANPSLVVKPALWPRLLAGISLLPLALLMVPLINVLLHMWEYL